jgi:hypothetical protein
MLVLDAKQQKKGIYSVKNGINHHPFWWKNRSIVVGDQNRYSQIDVHLWA